MIPPLLFIVGMQKSGTTLLNRLLMMQDDIDNPFLPEGKALWGDDPPFNPEQAPCGALFQAHGGRRGHHLTADDYSTADHELLRARLRERHTPGTVLLSKNPYNAVRIGWLRAHFPDAVIVCMLRQPLANVYSLYKKFHPHEHIGAPPQDGWWGIKPDRWEDLKNADVLQQLAEQWCAVNREILAHRAQLDLCIEYGALCAQPNAWLDRILAACKLPANSRPVAALDNRDHEQASGSRLKSANKEFAQRGDLSLAGLRNEATELAPFSASQREKINAVCAPLWRELQALSRADVDA